MSWKRAFGLLEYGKPAMWQWYGTFVLQCTWAWPNIDDAWLDAAKLLVKLVGYISGLEYLF